MLIFGKLFLPFGLMFVKVPVLLFLLLIGDARQGFQGQQLRSKSSGGISGIELERSFMVTSEQNPCGAEGYVRMQDEFRGVWVDAHMIPENS